MSRLSFVGEVSTASLHFLLTSSGKLRLGINLLFLRVHVFTNLIASVGGLDLADQFVVWLEFYQ
jgi:hypothetical protein|tara:strand:- start:216 stop:407 length:192 start_codon:yes stop_codon:yes gene_type:complete